LQELEGYNDLCDIYNVDEPSLFLNIQHSKTFTFQGNFCHGDTKSKHPVTVLLMCNADGSYKLPPLVIGKYKSPHCFKNVKSLLTKYEANTNSWMTTEIFKDCLIQLDRKLGAKSRKILLFIDQFPAHLKNMTFLCNNKVVFLPAKCTGQLQALSMHSSASTESS
jgi:hypothetical protein